MRDISKPNLFLVVAVLVSLLAWHSFFPDPPRGSVPLCPAALPGGLDPQLLVVLDYERPRASDAQKWIFIHDLEELLLAGRYQILSAQSEAGRVTASCVAWRLEVTFGSEPMDPAAGDASPASLSILHYGQAVEQVSEFPEADPEAAAILPLLRRTIASRLELGSVSGRPAGLHDPLSDGFRDRLRAMRHHAEGRAGLAVHLLRQAIERDGGDAALDFRLGHVLGGWAEEMQVAGTRPLWKGKEAGPRLEAESRRMLAESRLHLDRSLAADGKSPLALYSRGRVWRLLGDEAAAENDFARALEIWPAFGEATSELARLRSARRDLEAFEPRLTGALLLLDRRRPGLRADLLQQLGRARLELGNPAGAAAALEEALAGVPVERRQFRLEALDLLARAQSELGHAAAADRNRKAHRALVAAGAESPAKESSPVAVAPSRSMYSS